MNIFNWIRGEPPPINWGAFQLPHSEDTGHFLAVGAPGSGKTIVLRLRMQSVLQRIGPGVDARSLIYDAKGDLLPILTAICQPGVVKTLNPFDTRGVAWDMARDVTEPRLTVEIAFTLIPREQESQPFFSDAARHLIYGVMLSFLLDGRSWTFAELLRTLDSRNSIQKALARHSRTKGIIRRYFYDGRLASHIMSSLATKLLPYQPVAASWEAATERVALSDWINSSTILVIGNAEESRTAINAINRCLVKRASDLTLALSESFTRRVYFFFDELSEAGKLDGLVSLMKKGRSKGASVTLAFQTISGLRDQQMYGTHQTDDILGQIANRFIGRLECPETAEWASRLFGDQEIEQSNVGYNLAPNSASQSGSHNHSMRRAVLPVELMSIPPCNPENGHSGYYLLREYGAHAANIPARRLFGQFLIPPDPNVPEFIQRNVETQYLNIPPEAPQASMDARTRTKRPRKKKSDSLPPPPWHDIDPDGLFS